MQRGGCQERKLIENSRRGAGKKRRNSKLDEKR